MIEKDQNTNRIRRQPIPPSEAIAEAQRLIAMGKRFRMSIFGPEVIEEPIHEPIQDPFTYESIDIPEGNEVLISPVDQNQPAPASLPNERRETNKRGQEILDTAYHMFNGFQAEHVAYDAPSGFKIEHKKSE